MAPLAYGALHLKPWEFGRLTIGEFNQLLEGYKWRNKQAEIRTARFFVPTINACSRNLKHPIKAETLIGFDPVKEYREERAKEMLAGKSGDDLRADLSNLINEMG